MCDVHSTRLCIALTLRALLVHAVDVLFARAATLSVVVVVVFFVSKTCISSLYLYRRRNAMYAVALPAFV